MLGRLLGQDRRRAGRIERRTLAIDDLVVEVRLQRARHLRLTVRPPDGAVRVTAPLRTSQRAIREFVLGHREWIRVQQQAIAERPGEPAPTFTDGEAHLAWGAGYPIAVLAAARTGTVELRDRRLLLRVGDDASRERRRAALERWYREETRTAAAPLVERWSARLGLPAPRVSVRRMSSRWGSCTPRGGSIRLNSELAKWPPACLEYIVVHELVHFLEPSHNRRFHALMDRHLPGWQSTRRLLREPQRALPAPPPPAPPSPLAVPVSASGQLGLPLG